MKTRMKSRMTRAGRTARDRAVRTPGGLSLRLDVRALAVVVLLLLAALAAERRADRHRRLPDPARRRRRRRCSANGTPAQEFIVNDLRLPRVLVGLLVGASLGLGGALFQSISRNPLGSPDVLGFGAGRHGRRARS